MAPLRTAKLPVRVDGEAQSLERTLRIVAPAACPQPANKLGKLGILLRQLEKIAYLESRRVGIEEVTKPDNPHTKLGNLLVLMPHHGLQIVMKLQRNFLNAHQKVSHALRKVDAKHEVDLIRHERGSPFLPKRASSGVGVGRGGRGGGWAGFGWASPRGGPGAAPPRLGAGRAAHGPALRWPAGPKPVGKIGRAPGRWLCSVR